MKIGHFQVWMAVIIENHGLQWPLSSFIPPLTSTCDMGKLSLPLPGIPYTQTNGPRYMAVGPSYCGLLWRAFFCIHSVLFYYLLYAQITGYKGLRSPGSTASLPDPIWVAPQLLSAPWFYPGEYSAILPFDYLFLLIVDFIWLRVYGTNVSTPFRRKNGSDWDDQILPTHT